MADPAHSSDYVHGSQEIGEQRATFSLFMSLAKWGSLHVAALLAFLVLTFMHGGSLIMGLGAFVVLHVVGYFALKSRPGAH